MGVSNFRGMALLHPTAPKVISTDGCRLPCEGWWWLSHWVTVYRGCSNCHVWLPECKPTMGIVSGIRHIYIDMYILCIWELMGFNGIWWVYWWDTRNGVIQRGWVNRRTKWGIQPCLMEGKHSKWRYTHPKWWYWYIYIIYIYIFTKTSEVVFTTNMLDSWQSQREYSSQRELLQNRQISWNKLKCFSNMSDLTCSCNDGNKSKSYQSNADFFVVKIRMGFSEHRVYTQKNCMFVCHQWIFQFCRHPKFSDTPGQFSTPSVPPFNPSCLRTGSQFMDDDNPQYVI